MPIPPSASRPAAPRVDPIEFAGIRYEQDRTDERQGDQNGGYLAAIDIAKGERLWRVKVYEVSDSRAAGVEMGGIYFRSMEFIDDHQAIRIENEVGGIYRVDLNTREVQDLSPPSPESAPVTPKPKPMPE